MAVTKTPNAALNLIPFDEQPWDEDANENTSIIDGILGQFFSIPNFVGVWKNSTNYAVPQTVIDAVDGTQWVCNISHVSANSPTTFSADRTANPTYWTSVGASSAANAASAAASAAAAANSAAQQGQNVGRNLVLNSMFRIAQRGLGPFTAFGTYTADRWLVAGGTDTVSILVQPITDAGRVDIGDEIASSALSTTVAGSAAAAAFTTVVQHMENVRVLAGKTVTVSFWANAGVAGLKLGVNISQNFGTGGSPSPSVVALPVGVAANLTTTWTRYTFTIPVPSIAGKTLGTNTDNFTSLQFWYSSGATNNATAGNIGVQAGLINLWGVQVEVGSVATLLEKLDTQQDLAKCQRFYETGSFLLQGYLSAGGQNLSSMQSFAVTKRGTVSMTTSGVSNNNATLGMDATPNALRIVITAIAGGTTYSFGTFSATADL